MSAQQSTRKSKKKTQKNYYIFKEFVYLPENLIIKDFEQIIDDQNKDNVIFTDSFETIDGNVFQDVGSNAIQKSAYTSYHSHNYYEINYINSGLCYEYVNGKFMKLKKGDILLMSPSICHSCYLTPYSTGTNFCISKRLFDKLSSDLSTIENLNYMKDLQNTSSYYLFHSRDSVLLSTLFSELIRYSQMPLMQGTLNFLRMERNLNLMFFELHCRMADKQIEFETNSSKLKLLDNEFSEITKFITNNLPIVTRKSVENYFGYSPMGLYRIMQKNGTTFQEHLTKIRQRRAIYLLKHTKLSVTEISKALGFESTEYFCRFFKKHHNMSPTEYREKYKSGNLADASEEV